MAVLKRLPGIFLTVYLTSLLALESHAAQTRPRWNTASLVANQDDEVTVTCTVKNVGMFDPVRLFKKNKEDVHTITDDGKNVKEPFAATNRYQVSEVRDGTTRTSKLTYKGIRGEDEGQIGCRVLVNDASIPIAYVNISVRVPVNQVYMVKLREDRSEVKLGEGERVKVTDGEEGGIACVATVNGSTKVPNVRLVAGERKEDITDLFDENPRSHIIDANGGLGKYSSEMKRSYYTLHPRSDLNDKKVICEAEVEGFDTKTASIMLNIYYAPNITCPKYRRYANVGSGITITCEVNSNPDSTIEWDWGEEVPLSDEETRGDISSTKKDLGNHRTEVSLMINPVTEEHFGQYTLSADNGIDVKRITVTLIKGEEQANAAYNTPNAGAVSRGVPLLKLPTMLSILLCSFAGVIRPL